MILSPVGMSFYDWASQVSYALNRFGPAPMPSEWRQWASDIVQLPGLADKLPPRPDRYADWYTWAMEFNLAVDVPL